MKNSQMVNLCVQAEPGCSMTIQRGCGCADAYRGAVTGWVRALIWKAPKVQHYNSVQKTHKCSHYLDVITG